MSQHEDPHAKGLTRRAALVGGVVGAAGLAAAAGALGRPGGAPAPSSEDSGTRPAGDGRQPVVFLPHGGGPWPFVDMGMGQGAGVQGLLDYLKALPAVPRTPPRALLVISAHWEEDVPTVTTGESPALYFDYYGFPPESYQLTWPAPGDPRLAARVRALLEQSGLRTAAAPDRGFDHGTFVPLKVAYPEAQLPVVQLSLVRGLDPRLHLELGRALRPLRDEGVFIVGSGMSYHNMRGFMHPDAGPISQRYDAWLRETAALEASERDRRLIEWTQAPAARAVHPREEHLLPLMVVAGAAGDDRATVPYNDDFMGVRLSAYHFA